MVMLMFALLGLGCEGPTHENIDHWIRTEKGPDKLRSTLADTELAVDLRAHAAQNLVGIDELPAVLELLTGLEEADRQAVIAALAPRLWDHARISGALTRPSADQVLAKDALFELRQLASADARALIDGYLIDWLVGGYYVGRAREGRVQGAAIVRAVGPAATPELLAATRAVVEAPAGADGARLQVEFELLVGLAATGSPEAVDYLLGLIEPPAGDAAGEADTGDDTDEQQRRDPALPKRALDALYRAYVDPQGRFPVCAGDSLLPHLDRLSALARDPDRPLTERDDLIALIGQAPAPACVAALTPLISGPVREPMVRWVSANAALRCGRGDAIVPVSEALPTAGAYEVERLAGVLWTPMAALEDHAVVAAKARILLQSKSWVARVIGVELLGHLSLATDAAEDAVRVRALSGDRTPLRGWWGDQRELPRGERKPLPRLGERAAAVAEQLAQLAKTGQKS